MRAYDQIVVGGGISGLTLAALLGLNGKRVLLLEKGPRVGGSMLRFTRHGVPFDTGFHFTGGVEHNGLLTQMLRVLGISDAIRLDPIRHTHNNRFIFEDTGNAYEQPIGYHKACDALKRFFPGDRDGIGKVFEMMRHVCRQTAAMELRSITTTMPAIEEEGVALHDVLGRLVSDSELKTLLSAYAVCYGTPPEEISFANHSRVAYPLFQGISRVVGGGQAFVDALSKVLAGLDVDVECGTTLSELSRLEGPRATEFRLTSGERVTAKECIATIHPHSLLDLLPQSKLHKAFMDRVRAFQPSIGFFSVFGVVRSHPRIKPFSPAIITRFPSSDVHNMLRPKGNTDRAMVIMEHQESCDNGPHNVLTIHEVATVEDTAAWSASSPAHRPPGYLEYKKQRTERLTQRVLEEFPEYEGQLDCLASASMLTYRDYLHSPWGCAYGIKQPMGQFNLFGRLPIRNIYAAGQSAMLPGLVGAMMSSFIVMRMLLGKEEYQPFIDGRLASVEPHAEALC